MDRRNILRGLAAIAALSWLGAANAASTAVNSIIKPIKKSKADWKKLLPAAAFSVLFEEDTERPNTSALNKEYRDGIYVCAACMLPLFASKAKFDSGTGWPSFTYPIEGRVTTKTDYKLIWPRTEYHCTRCGGHQGHLFDDGPKPTGKRYCNNGVALKFILKGSALPALRA